MMMLMQCKEPQSLQQRVHLLWCKEREMMHTASEEVPLLERITLGIP